MKEDFYLLVQIPKTKRKTNVASYYLIAVHQGQRRVYKVNYQIFPILQKFNHFKQISFN
jgi:hypothetical protein